MVRSTFYKIGAAGPIRFAVGCNEILFSLQLLYKYWSTCLQSLSYVVQINFFCRQIIIISRFFLDAQSYFRTMALFQLEGTDKSSAAFDFKFWLTQSQLAEWKRLAKITLLVDIRDSQCSS